MSAKADYVARQLQTRSHHCHWPGCDAQVPPAKWGCKRHWFALPPQIRAKIWNAFRPGQEVDQRPSRQYVEAAREAQSWIAAHLAKKSEGPKQGSLF
ncbi:hypothetical protein [Phenylobacterium sp.]|uniref:hypothetical protein n=1 Tax=Phenylobacterium sp. TaxID=1871053 RepID=UPI0027301502|nr:hypothetical protein [Phenylobacterium sp.]MDP2214752.1 hypothetical protein [Phenylobacterium sp.]